MTDRTTLYGIKACSTMQKARAWLTAHDVDYVFHDYRKSGLDAAMLAGWCGRLGWDRILNRSGTTFRKLADTEKADMNAEKAQALMLGQPSMIRRPILVRGAQILVGFTPDTYAAFFEIGA